MTPTISIIIPAYNVARFVDRGISSLMAQTCGDFEVIIVDDGSTDGVTPSSCDTMATRYDNISVIHKPNGGVGSARNCGIDNAKGEYVGFFDIDDLIEPDMINRCKECIRTDLPDMLIFGYRESSDSYPTIDFRFTPHSVTSNNGLRDIFKDNLMGITIPNGFVWNKVYRRQFLLDNSLRFNNDAIQQDEIFNLSCYACANKVTVLPDILYNYFVYDAGNNRSRYIAGRLEIYRNVMNAFKNLLSFWHLNCRQTDNYIYRRFMLGVIICLDSNIPHPGSGLNHKERRGAVSEIFNDRDVRQAVEHLRSNKTMSFDIVSKTYISAIRHRSQTLYRWARILSSLRNAAKPAVLFFKRR